MKKIVVCLLIIMLCIGCGRKVNKYALDFKREYEALNGKTNKIGKKHRSVTIDEDNPYMEVKAKKIVNMITNKETFYLYVGSPLCPWCRSVVEKSIEVAKEYDIDRIYYINIWDKDGNEIFRDKYELQDGNPIKVKDGTSSYNYLLKSFDSVLSNYLLPDDNGNEIDTGEKRIYAPNFFYIKKGKVVKLIEGYSTLQKDSRENLTDDMLKDEEEEFKVLFEGDSTCSVGGC